MLSKKLGIDQILKHFNNKRAFVRVDFNVPVKEGKVKDATRIQAAVPTIKKILEQNPKGIVLASHLGRPDGKRVDKHTLKSVIPTLEKELGTKVTFINDCVGKEVEQQVQSGRNGEIFLLENLRFHLEEEGSTKDEKGNKIKADPKKVAEFRSSLTKLGDVYVNDAFGTAHRAHSSMVGVNLPIRAAGYLMKKELEYFSKALEQPQKPYTVILGGAKVKDKIQLIKNMLDKVDEMIIGGGMAFTFIKKIHGINIGKSLFDEEGYKIIDEILTKAKEKGVKIHLPIDFICGQKLDQSSEVESANLQTGIKNDWLGLDIGPESVKLFNSVLNKSKTVVWNGPQGAFEIEKFRSGSLGLLDAFVGVSNNGGTTIVGGGDTVSLVNLKPNLAKQISHISTGGGASLELLEGKPLPGVNYLTNIEDLKN